MVARCVQLLWTGIYLFWTSCSYRRKIIPLQSVWIHLHTDVVISRHTCWHTWEKGHLFACKYYFSCAAVGDLKKNMLKHSGENQFICNECNYKCRQASDLKKHMFTHSGQKPFNCNECNYKCSQAPNLKKHMFTHSAEKPFTCTQCNYFCTQAGDLKKHMLKHSGGKPLICNYKCR